MKKFCFYSFLLLALAVSAQDKLYLINGDCKTGKVVEVGVDDIKIETEEAVESYRKNFVLLIQYSNGMVEKYTTPEKTVVFKQGENVPERSFIRQEDLSPHNQVYVNTLALCNSDISVFYERLTKNKYFGLGLMGAYNFNPQASIINSNIYILTSGKKNYDLGAFANWYLGGLKDKTTYYFGILFKYTNLSFKSVSTDSAKVGSVYAVTTISKDAAGSQLSTMFTIGSHTAFTKNFFLKSTFGVGGFNLHGIYKQQYNVQANAGVPIGSQYNRSFLLKLYLGISAGFNF